MKLQLTIAAALLLAIPALAQNEDQGQGKAIVTILPKKEGAAPPRFTPQDLKLQVSGSKDTAVSTWTPLPAPQSPLELILLIDRGARSSFGNQLEDLNKFVLALPPSTRVGIAYMANGGAQISSPLSDDRAQVLKGLHITSGTVGINGSPYFCLSDLAKRWPSAIQQTRREVIMITDGVDNYNRRYDPDDPYVQNAIADAARINLVVYSLFWKDQGRANNTQYENNAGQSLLLQVSEATGGRFYGIGLENPVSLQPYLDDINRRLRNQYELNFLTRLHGKAQVMPMKLKLVAPNTDVDFPKQVFVYPKTSQIPQ